MTQLPRERTFGMKRIILAATALVLLLAPAAGADTGSPDPVVKQRHHHEIVVRGVVLAVSPISVRASIGAIVTCEVRNRQLVKGLVVGDRVRMKCIGIEGRWILRRLAINPGTPPVEPARARAVRVAPAIPVAPTSDGLRGTGR
jgi:hypothetical protein